jgi:hypothetical protein
MDKISARLFRQRASVLIVTGSVSDLHSLYADPAFLTNADPDPILDPRLKLANFFQSEIQFNVFIK